MNRKKTLANTFKWLKGLFSPKHAHKQVSDNFNLKIKLEQFEVCQLYGYEAQWGKFTSDK